VTTGREEVGSEASIRVRRAAAAALATGALLVGAAVAVADPGQPPPPPPAPPTVSSGGSTTGSGTSTGGTAPPADTKPPPRAHNLVVSAPRPGQIVLTWRLVHPTDVASVFVKRGPASHCPNAPVPLAGFFAGRQIGGLDPRSHQIDPTERDTKRYCYAVFTLDAAGNWAKPVTHRTRNPGDTKPPAAVRNMTATFGQGGAVRLAWTNPPDAVYDLVVRGRGSGCPHFEADGTRVGTRRLRTSEVDSTVPRPGTYCYAVFAYDAAGNASPIVRSTVKPPATAPATTSAVSPPPSQPGSSGSSLPSLVALLGGGALVIAGLAYATMRLVRREWEWHTRTGYGIRDLVSIEVRDSDRLALVIPAIIGVCIAGAVVVLVLSL
jgi:hypothetical protein